MHESLYYFQCGGHPLKEVEASPQMSRIQKARFTDVELIKELRYA